jgi:DNA phosphorothioation-associated putative methyltransferase
VVTLGYVDNVNEDPRERADSLGQAWALSQAVLIVSARMEWEASARSSLAYGDGTLTSKGTFQKFFRQEELRAWIDDVLGVRSVAAAPGMFYVFRDDIRAQSYLAARVRRRPTMIHCPLNEVLYETNRQLLEPLMAFVEARGRAPEPFELQEATAIVERFGSLGAAVSIVRRMIGDDAWREARTAASNDLLVYLALAAFRRRSKFTSLPPDLQLDVRAFFGIYKAACERADELLFRAGDQAAIDRACRNAPVGKLTREALYIHTTALPRLDPLLRVYEGCGRALTGGVEEATIVKLNRIEPKVSYLVYPTFDQDPHPALKVSVRAGLKGLDVRVRDFRGWADPPILHRKETFVSADYPGRDIFARLTGEEEEAGLFAEPSVIGMRGRWAALLESKGLEFRDHRLVHRGGAGSDVKPS